MGPTACGKTDTATIIYDAFNCELVSVDAAQVYRGMDIGTAKPDAEFLNKYPHHLIDITEITQPYSAARFCDDADELIDAIHKRSRVPVFVGGTLFYFSALENGLSDLPESNSGIRLEIENLISTKGLPAVYQDLVRIDSDMAKRLSPTDSQRIARAMEIFRITNRAPSTLMTKKGGHNSERQIVKMALFTGNRKTLHQKIEQRFLRMLDHGLVEEVKRLIQDLSEPETLPSMRSVGYRQVLEFLNGNLTYDQMVENGVSATRQLAKRQLTWLRNQSNVVWFDISHPQSMTSILAFLHSLGIFQQSK